MRCAGRHEPNGHPGEPGQLLLPTQTHHAKVRSSWTENRSSNKTPTRRNATQKIRPTLYTPLGQEEATFPRRNAILATKPGTPSRHSPRRVAGATHTHTGRNSPQVARKRQKPRSKFDRAALALLHQAKSLCHRTREGPTFTGTLFGDQGPAMTREPIVSQKPTYPPQVAWHDIAKSISPKPVRLARTHSKFRFCHTTSYATAPQIPCFIGTTTAGDLHAPSIAFLASFS